MLRGQAALRGSLAIGALAAGAAAMAACAGQAVLGSSVTTVASPVSATIFVAKIPGLGRALVTSGGRTLYLLSSDPPGKSNCIGSCEVVWPPLVVNGPIKAGPGVDAALVSTYKRPDSGQYQVLYRKHALYTFEQDTGPNMATGEDIQTYGGTWWAVSPSGAALKR